MSKKTPPKNPLIIQHIDTHENEHDNFLVCCFFTQNYASHAESLKTSLQQFQLGYCFMQVDNVGHWEANTRLKPHFVAACLEKFPHKNILYLDADAVVKKPLDFFNHVKQDVSFYKTKGMAGMSHDYLASTLFFRNTENTKALVNAWIAAQTNGKRTQVDQDSLDIAMLKMANKLSVAPLPAGYIKIFDRDDYQGEIYIEQYQASRGQTKLRRQLIRRRNKVAIISVLSLGLVAGVMALSK